ncbi:hypothetical protein B0O99DRAFT_681765 [Bisporella sp. PMI_857]|nr:hypothetical protein B0O99DRAFT_681765 [Bisporella sp. PMI_857]
MSQTKDDLLRHLNLSPDIYTLMAKEVDRAYKELTSNKHNLKKNCKRKPPYDWSDIVEKAKDRAMEAIAQNGDTYTTYYWNLAVPTEDCPNWIARWFLYHKFRYRDGRNRNLVRGNSAYGGNEPRETYSDRAAGMGDSSSYYASPSGSASYGVYRHLLPPPQLKCVSVNRHLNLRDATPFSSSAPSNIGAAQCQYYQVYHPHPEDSSSSAPLSGYDSTYTYTEVQVDGRALGTYYDPVRDAGSGR